MSQKILSEGEGGNERRNKLTFAAVTVMMKRTVVARLIWIMILRALYALGANQETGESIGVIVTTSLTQQVLLQAQGKYVRDGEAWGYDRYKLESTSTTRYMYRSGSKGLWTITGSEANVGKNKGTIVSRKISDTPTGQQYKYYHNGKVSRAFRFLA